jgi:hypothetical protein
MHAVLMHVRCSIVDVLQSRIIVTYSFYLLRIVVCAKQHWAEQQLLRIDAALMMHSCGMCVVPCI